MIMMSSTSTRARPFGTSRRVHVTYRRLNVDTPSVWTDHSRRARTPDRGHGCALGLRVGIAWLARRACLTSGGDDARAFSLGFPLTGEAVISVACCAVQILESEHVGDAGLVGQRPLPHGHTACRLATTHDIGEPSVRSNHFTHNMFQAYRVVLSTRIRSRLGFRTHTHIVNDSVEIRHTTIDVSCDIKVVLPGAHLNTSVRAVLRRIGPRP